MFMLSECKYITGVGYRCR